MFRHVILLAALGCATPGAPVPPSVDLARSHDREACDVREALAATRVDRDFDWTLPAEREPVVKLLPGLPAVQAAWHRAARCASVTPTAHRASETFEPLQASAWLTEHAKDLVAAGQTEAALEQLADIWRGAAGLRFSGGLSDLTGLAIQLNATRVMEENAHRIPAEARSRLAKELLAEAEVTPSLALSAELDRRSWDAEPWQLKFVLTSVSCMLLEVRMGETRRRVEALPLDERADAWRRAFVSPIGGPCMEVETVQLRLQDQAAMVELLREQARR